MKPKLESTTDYTRFEVHECNRDERPDPKLAESMRKYGFWPTSPIEVRKNGNGKMKVIRGHHRLSEAKRQGLPVWFICYDTKASIFDAEGSTHQVWNVQDFATAYARAGQKDCQCLMRFKDRHGLTMGAAASLVGGQSAGSHNKSSHVKAGTFQAGDMKHANEVVRITDHCHSVGVEFAKTTGFVAAVSLACHVKEFDQDLFMSRVSLYPKMMSRRARSADYLLEIESLYNYTSHKRIPLVFLAKEAASNRSAADNRKK